MTLLFDLTRRRLCAISGKRKASEGATAAPTERLKVVEASPAPETSDYAPGAGPPNAIALPHIFLLLVLVDSGMQENSLKVA